MMQFREHPDPLMGLYLEPVENDLHGRSTIEWCFNLAENPALAKQYLAWLAEGNTPEPWEAPNGA